MKLLFSPVSIAVMFVASALTLLVGAAAVPEKPADTLTLVSPDGENKITLQAGNHTSGIWITHAGRKDQVAIFIDGNGAAVGVYGDVKGGNNYSGIVAGPSSPDGRLQLAVDGKPKVFSAADLE